MSTGNDLLVKSLLIIIAAVLLFSARTHAEGEPVKDDAALMAACRRDPRWRTINPDDCYRLLEWNPRDHWWKADGAASRQFYGQKIDDLVQCLNDAMDQAERENIWTETCENEVSEGICEVEPISVMGHYVHVDQGEITMFGSALTEQEAFAIEALERCARETFNHEMPFYEVREFGEDGDEDAYGLYNVAGGNYCTFLQGLIQMHIPGVAATIMHILQTAYDENKWGESLGYPPPNTLGIRTAEFLRYRKTGKLGLHEDGGSVYSISIALSNPSDYEGGYFMLATKEAIFKLQRRSAIVFFSESNHAITDILQGERTVFVVEAWEGDDAPVGLPRPTEEDFDNYRQGRSEF